MKKMFVASALSGLVFLFVASAAWAQKGAPPPPSSPSSGSGSYGTTTPAPTPGGGDLPLYVTGRVAAEDTGQPITDPVAVALYCHASVVQTVHTDNRGSFQISLSSGAGSDSSFDASDDETGVGALTDDNVPQSLEGGGRDLTGCEVRLSGPGYRPFVHVINQAGDSDYVNLGLLTLRSVGKGPGGAVSVSALLVPDKARKEFDQGQKDAQKKNAKAAQADYERAVADYDKYAPAWAELGKIYASNDPDKARDAFQKAITGDPEFVPAYVYLANLQLEAQDDKDAVDTAGKALGLEPGNGTASFLLAEGDYHLNRLDDAEKSARDAENAGGENVPDVHALLATLLMQEHKDEDAAAEINLYLKLAPRGEFAVDFKAQLARIYAGARSPDATSPAAQP